MHSLFVLNLRFTVLGAYTRGGGSSPLATPGHPREGGLPSLGFMGSG